ncbi:MAG: 4-oxalocrotonate tautomerase family protein [Chthoniobacterales bacterium]
MPYVHLQITKGATRIQKKKIVEEFTASLVRNLGKEPEHIHVVIDEIAEENWGFAGMLTDDYRRDRRATDGASGSGGAG